MLVQVIDIQYGANQRGAEWATARNAIPTVHRDVIPDTDSYALMAYAPSTKQGRFVLKRPSQHYRQELKDYGLMLLPDAVRILPGRPAWSIPSRKHQPNFDKALPLGAWGQFRTNARFPDYDGTKYFEWIVNIANSDAIDTVFAGDPSWQIDHRADLW